MTLEEAIIHCKEKACDNTQCALEHRQLAEWLIELKKLRSQITWKPSDEQMKALEDALGLAKSCGEYNAFDLRILYEQFKKLQE